MTSSPLSIAVIGLGWVATNRHIPIILRNPRLQLYGVVDKRAERIERIKADYPNLQTSLSLTGAMPWGENVRAALIATDPLQHFGLAKKMLLAGKHVLMEKPLTMTPAEAHELLELAAQKGLSLCVVHNFQFARSVLRLQTLIRQGKLGEIQSIEALQLSNPRRRLPVWYEQLPFGLFYDESPHMFYLLEALAGTPLQHLDSNIVRRAGQNTPISVSAQYAAGLLPVRLNMNFEAALSEWHIAVMGSKAIGIVDVFRDILVTLPNDNAHRAREILTSSASTIATHLSGFFQSGLLLARGRLFYGADLVWERFLEEVQNLRPATEISAARGLRIVELQHELINNSRFVDLPTR